MSRCLGSRFTFDSRQPERVRRPGKTCRQGKVLRSEAMTLEERSGRAKHRWITTVGVILAVLSLMLLGSCDEGPGTTVQPPPEQPEPEPQSKWETSTSTDPLDDSEILIAAIKADEERRTVAFTFIARCRAGTRETHAYIVWGGYLVLGDLPNPYRRSVTVRVGTDAARTETWSVSQNGQATFSREPIRLLRELVGESRLILHTEIPGVGSVSAIFEIDGARAALKPISDACGW